MESIPGATGADAGGATLPPRTPAQVPHRRAQILSVLGTFAGVIFLHILAGVVIIGVLAGFDAAPLTLTPELLVILASVTSSIFLIVGIVAGARSPGGFTRSLRIVPGRLGIGMVLVSVFVFICLSQVADSILDLTGWAEGSLLADMSKSMSQASGITLIAAVVALGIGGGLGEEVFFRGYMQTRLRPAIGAWPAIIATAAAFGLMHFDFVHTPVAFLFGVLFGWIAEKAGSIVPTIAAHIINNIMAVLGAALLPVPETTTPDLALTAVFLPAGVLATALIAWRVPGFAPLPGAHAA